MAALNYYLGLPRGAGGAMGNVVAGTSSAGTAVDVEVRIQMDPGTGPTGITSLDVRLLLKTIINFMDSSGLNHAGADLPPL
jgi:hypothetical protein